MTQDKDDYTRELETALEIIRDNAHHTHWSWVKMKAVYALAHKKRSETHW